MKDPHFALYGATDGRYKILWNLTPGNMYGTKNINGVDYGDVNHGSSATKIFKSWIAAENSDSKVKDLLKRIRCYPEIQLFDLKEDSWELQDLANKPEHKAKVEELKTAISDWMKQQGDDGHLTGEGIKYAETEFAK